MIHSRVVLSTYLEKFWSNVEDLFGKTKEDCWNWIGLKNKGYGGPLTINNKKIYAHRFSFVMNNGNIPDYLQVCHRCDNPSCINPNHLFSGTQSDNRNDSKQKGRNKNWGLKSKLSLTEVKEIKQLAKTHTRKFIAEKFKISKSYLSEIINGTAKFIRGIN